MRKLVFKCYFLFLKKSATVIIISKHQTNFDLNGKGAAKKCFVCPKRRRWVSSQTVLHSS